MSRGCPVLIAAACLCTACRAEPAPSPLSAGAAEMPSGIVARVGDMGVTADAIARIAVAQKISLTAARDAAVHDALLAAGARTRGLDGDPTLRAQVQAVLARRVLQQLLADAERAGPVTDEELRAATARRWLDLDRPEGFRTVHAVVRLPERADTATRDKARAVAEAIRAAAAAARDLALRTEPPSPVAGKPPADPAAEAFQQAARAVAAEGLTVVAEPLPPVTATGRVLVPETSQFDPDFSRAAAALAARGDLSPPVTSAFGVHVIMLLERIPPSVVPEGDRRRLVHDAVMADRARAAQGSLLATLRREPVVADGLDALLSIVRIEP